MEPVVVTRWSGREARALRAAMRMSIRQFAAHLGLTDAAIAQWEHRGEKAQLRYETQQLLDLELERATAGIQARFAGILEHRGNDRFGARSTERTRALLDILRPGNGSQPPEGRGADGFRQFLGSVSRVFVVTGILGSGRTVFAHLADVDHQLHSSHLWTRETCLATEILRYAGMPAGDDPLLTLERICASLRRPCLIVIDGIDTGEQFERVGRRVEGVLRQVLCCLLRFVLITRARPDIGLSGYPVLAASAFSNR